MDITNQCKNDDYEPKRIDSTSYTARPSISRSVGDGNQTVDSDLAHFSVTTVLSYCKTKILKPYLRLLSITGLRSFSNDQSESITFSDCCSYVYIFVLLLLMIMGYLLQYMACFRRDRGFGYIVLERGYRSERHNDLYEHICNDSILFSYAIPHILHFMGYVYAFFIFRSSGDDQLPSLMETVFLSLSNLSNGFQSQKRLIKTLWIFVSISLVWMILSLITAIIMMGEGIIEFKWLTKANESVTIIMKVLLIVSTLWHDVIQATVISNYCLQSQLLTSYIFFLKEKLIQNLTQLTEWIKDVEEFKKLLCFLNGKLSASVCLFSLVNICRAFTGVLWLLDLDKIDRDNVCAIGINILNIILWMFLSATPFIQAARLSSACEVIRSVGHETRV
ncbi:hypothetical protein AMK59_6415, partial [Oryctes borbonicus]